MDDNNWYFLEHGDVAINLKYICEINEKDYSITMSNGKTYWVEEENYKAIGYRLGIF